MPVVCDGSHRRLGAPRGEVRGISGLYYIDKVTVNLHNTVGKTIVYLDLKAEDLETDDLGSYIKHVDRLCNSVEVKNWTRCSQFRESVSDRYRHLRSSESLLIDTVGEKIRRLLT